MLRALLLSMVLLVSTQAAFANTQCQAIGRKIIEDYNRANTAYGATVDDGQRAATNRDLAQYCEVLLVRIGALNDQLDALNDYPEDCFNGQTADFIHAMDKMKQSLERRIENWWKARDIKCN